MLVEELSRWGWALSFAMNGIVALVLWGMRGNFASKGEVAAQLERRDEARSREHAEAFGRISSLEQRASRAEAQLAAVPSQQSVHHIEVRLEQISGDVRALGESLRPLGPAVTRIQQHLMEGR